MAIKVREGLDYKILDDDYRKEFLTHNKPARVKRTMVNGSIVNVSYYRCIYCGCLVSHKEMQVDHIIPKTRYMAGILWNPNKAWNLGPSCPKCNISKSNYVDARVIKGFKNKILNKYGVSRKIADMQSKDIDLTQGDSFESNDDEKLKKVMPYIVALLYVITFLTPLIAVVAWAVQTALQIGVRLFKGVFKYGKRFLKWTYKKLKKTFKYYATHPKKLYILAGKIALVATVAYFGLAAFGVLPPEILSWVSNVGGVIWGIGSGFFEKIINLF